LDQDHIPARQREPRANRSTLPAIQGRMAANHRSVLCIFLYNKSCTITRPVVDNDDFLAQPIGSGALKTRSSSLLNNLIF
jgi:hypothetical protein